MKRAIAVALLTAACGDELPKPELIADLRVLGVRSEPAEGPPGTAVALDSLVAHPDPAAGIEQVWLACVAAGGVGVSPDACFTDTVPPLCAASPEAPLCIIGSGRGGAYTLPERALEDRPEGDDGQVVITTIAALEDQGGLDGCLDTFERDGTVAEFCRIAVKRIRVLADPEGAANANPALASLTLDGATVTVTLGPGSIEETPDGPEHPFLSWFVTAGELEHYRTDGDDGLVNEWTPIDAGGRVYVVVRDGRGGEGWIVGERSQSP